MLIPVIAVGDNRNHTENHRRRHDMDNPETAGTVNSLYSVSFIDIYTGYTAGLQELFLNTTNGGYGDFIRETGLPGSTYSIYPNPASNKIIIANTRMLFTKSISISICQYSRDNN